MFFILVVLALSCLGVSVWALCDIASKPESAFVGAGLSKTMWVILIAVFIVLFAPVALVLSIVYLSSVRPKLVSVAS
jgi:uncharacterized protein DUF2516